MHHFLRDYPKITAFICGLSAVAALPPYFMLPVLIPAFSILLLLINAASEKKQAFAIGYWFGFGFFALGFSWIGNALLIDAETFGWLYPLAFLGSGAFFGLFPGLAAWLTFQLPGFTARFFAFPAFWILSEWLRSFILSGFPWNLIGSALAFHPAFIQFAAIAGTYGLSLLLIYWAQLAAWPLHTGTKRSLTAALIAFITLSAATAGFGFARLHSYPDSSAPSEYKIRIVQPAIPQRLKWNQSMLEDNFRRYLELSRSPGLEKINMVIWGETASPFPLELDEQHRHLLQTAVPPHGYLMTGTLRYLPDSITGRYLPRNSMLTLDSAGNIAAVYDKSHLVPFGEYIPLRSYLPASLRPVTNTISDFQPGNGPQTLKLKDFPSLGTAICYEIIFPSRVIDRTDRPEILVNLTNDGWYGDSAGPRQHLTAARLRAVEEGITVVRAANSGISAVFSPLGKTLGRLELNVSGILDTALPIRRTVPAFYGQNGNLVPLGLCLLILIATHFFACNKLK